MVEDTVNVTAPVQDIARAYAIAADRGTSLSDLTIEAWSLLQAPLSAGDHAALDVIAESPKQPVRIRNSDIVSEFSLQGIRLADIDASDHVPGEPEHTARKILWGQFSRFLPVKFTLRVLVSLGNGPVTLVRWQEAVRQSSFQMREHLRAKDVMRKIPRGKQLAAGFPRGHRDAKKRESSMDRFLGHYTAHVQGSGAGPVVGMVAELGLIHVDLGSTEVRLTQAGIDYVMLQNPQIDEGTGWGGLVEGTTEPTSPEERAFLLPHVKNNLPEDWAFCIDVMSLISDGSDMSDALESSMAERYLELTLKTVRTNTVGALGRLTDLGLIKRTWVGRRVTYSLTTAGRDEI